MREQVPAVRRSRVDIVAVIWVLVLAIALRAMSALLMIRAATHPVAIAGINGIRGFPAPSVMPPARHAYWAMASSWDGPWFRLIAQHGYPHTLPTHDGVIKHNAYAYLPAYPMLVRWTMHVTGARFPVVGSVIALLCSLLAAVLMVVLLTPRVGRFGAVACAVLVMAAPASPIFQMTYSDGPALLVLVAVLLALERQRWLTAAGLMILAGLTRPIAAPLTVVVLVVVIAYWRSARPLRAAEWARLLVLVAASGLATVLWQVIAWIRTGDVDAYTRTEASWHSDHQIVPFESWVQTINRTTGHPWGVVCLVALFAAYVLLILSPLAARLGPAMRTWCITYLLYIGAVSDYITSDVRFALLLFPLPAVLIGAASRRRPSRTILLTAAVIVGIAFMTLQVAWIDDLLRPTTILQPV